MITTPQNKSLLIICLFVLACWSMWISDKVTVALIVGAFISQIDPKG